MDTTPTIETPQKQELPCYSLDGEYFYVEWGTFADQAADAGLQPGDKYFEATCTRMEGADACTIHEACGLIDALEARLYDLLGPGCEVTLRCSDAATEALRQFIVGWVNEHTDVGKYYLISEPAQEKVLSQAEVTW